MTVQEAISKKIKKILKEKNLTINKLATISCLTQSTVQSLVDGKSSNPTLVTIVKLCNGLDMTLSEFFGDRIFFEIVRHD